MVIEKWHGWQWCVLQDIFASVNVIDPSGPIHTMQYCMNFTVDGLQHNSTLCNSSSLLLASAMSLLPSMILNIHPVFSFN